MLFGASVLTSALVYGAWREEMRYSEGSAFASGKISEKTSPNCDEVCTARYAFVTPDGHTFQGRGDVGDSHRYARLEVGSEIEVQYLLEDPSLNRMPSISHWAVVFELTGITAVLVVAAGAVLVRLLQGRPLG